MHSTNTKPLFVTNPISPSIKGLPPVNMNVIGHRGLCSLAPENTLASFKVAKQKGLNWVEFDIQTCGTGEWVVLHDESVDRTTNGTGLIAELSYDEIKRLDAGSWFHPKFQNERIPSLAEVLTLLKDLEVQPNIEIKIPKTLNKSHALEHALNNLDHFLKVMNQYWSGHNESSPPLISSFEIEPLIFLKNKAPHIPLGYLVSKWHPDALDIVLQENFQTLHCDYQEINEAQLNQAKEANIPVLLYTVNERAISERLLNHGAFAVFSDGEL